MSSIKSGTVPPTSVSYKEKRPREYLVPHEVGVATANDFVGEVNKREMFANKY